MAYIEDPTILSEELTHLQLELKTIKAGDASSGNTVYVNVVFADGTRLYDPVNFRLGSPPDAGEYETWTLPVPPGLDRTLASISEIYLRKSGDNGWFLGSALLFANHHADPLLGNRHADQFLDNDGAVLLLREWSTGSFCVAQATDAEYPLMKSGYRVLGPVLGQVSDTSAVVLYRVDREGHYHFRAVDAATNTPVADVTAELEPTGRFQLTGLQPNRRYEFDLSFVRGGVESPVPDAAGSLRTYPAEGSRGRLCFAFGSCADSREQAAQGAWTAIRSLAEAPPPGIEPVRLFVHLGDSFYFYDHVTEETVRNVASMRAAHVSMRRHIEFLDMARAVPCCGIWDDHDFAYNNADSTEIEPAVLTRAVDTWMTYWGNNQAISNAHDLTTRVSHGLVDIYLLDGRSHRDKDQGVCFGKTMIGHLLDTIRRRGGQAPRVVVLATGSNWNHNSARRENYGDSAYKDEREELYSGLASLMGSSINGLLLLSGDDHINEIFHVDLGGGRMAPEFVSSPITLHSGLKDDPGEIEGERVASFPAGGDNGKRGFATLTIDRSRSIPDGNWTATVRYYQEATAAQHETRSYIASNGQFIPN